MSFASVALPLPVDKTYTYAIPADHAASVGIGSAVVVPFGRRILTGVVTALTTDEPTFKAKEIVDVVDPEPVLTPEQLDLTRWISDYYLCGWGEAVRASLPPGIDSASELRIRRIPNVDYPDDLTRAQHLLLSHLPTDIDTTLKALRRSVKSATLATLRTLASRGLLSMETQIRGPRTRVRTEQVVRLADNPSAEEPSGKRQIAVLEALRSARSDDQNNSQTISQPELLQMTGATSATVRRLEDLGYLTVFLRVIDRSESEMPKQANRTFDLNAAQSEAVAAINDAISRSEFQTFLLHGITGSGKTEVYIEAVRRVRSEGKSAIMLVPEIALTPQTVGRFRTRFGDEIAVLHSRMSPGERYDAWRGIRSGDSPIVIGPRSAILAPVQNLGLIVVDEEHEPSYKQYDPAPRYHARDVAVVRALNNNAVCVLGSATPSLESLANARSDKYHLLNLPERVETGGKRALLPAVRVVDMRSERRPGNAPQILSEGLREAISKRLSSKQQVILLQNRRGYSPLITCEACGWVPECPDCSVSMTWHKAKRHLRCHYCGRTAGLPNACPSCAEPALSRVGIGTQRVEEELHEAFPDARIVRMDLDTTSTKNAHHDILDDFASGKFDILLGTQMVAKGLDFERVTLVGVVDADTGLSLPDIRAEERAFHLLTQVAGRSGRADLPGEVIFQTRNPGHRIIQFAIRHDYEKFAREILAERMALGYPPSGRLAALLFSGPDEVVVFRHAERWVKLAEKKKTDLIILGPSASFVGRVRKQYRMQVMIKIPTGVPHRRVRELIRTVSESSAALPKGYRMAVDIDPVSLS